MSGRSPPLYCALIYIIDRHAEPPNIAKHKTLYYIVKRVVTIYDNSAIEPCCYGCSYKFMCGVGKTNHNDEPYIKPVIQFFFTNGIPLEPFVFLPRRKNSSAAPKCQPSEDEPPDH